MNKIIKYNVYLNERQDRKLKLLAGTRGKEPEEIINNAVYGYLAIVDPFAEDEDGDASDAYTDETDEKV